MKSIGKILALLMGLGVALTPLQSARAQAAPTEIVELARALKNDPDLIYEYVYNNIETLPIYGSLKGPIGALIDGKGTAFDQAELMVMLLQQAALSNSAISNPQYQLGHIWLNQAQLSNWLGVDNNTTGLSAVLGIGVIPTGTIPASGGLFICAPIMSVWVQVTIDGTARVFDPASKLSNQPMTELQNQPNACTHSGASPTAWGYVRSPGANLATATGYVSSTFLSRATSGANITTVSVAGLNRTNVRNDLTTYSNNLISWIRANAPAASTKDIIGGKTIQPLAIGLHQRWTSLPYLCTTADWASCSSVTTTSSLTSYRTTLKITVPGASQVTFNSSDLYGRRLTVFFNGSNQPVLALDGVTQATGSAVSPGVNVALATQITHPFTGVDQTGALNVPSGGQYLIANGWGGVGRGMIERHRKLLLKAQQQSPGAQSSEPVMGESLSVMANTWMAELAQANALVAATAKVHFNSYHNIGIAGVKTLGSGVGPFVDLPLNISGSAQLINRPAGGGTPLESSVFYVSGGLSSILESGIIEQTQPGSTAVSTVKLLDNASQTDTIFDINNSNVPGDNSTYWTSTIRPQLATYYTGPIGTSDLTRMDGLVSSGMRIIAALHGPQTISQWSGSGYFQITQAGNAIGAIISGGLSGGYSTAPVTIAGYTTNINVSQALPRTTAVASGFGSTTSSVPGYSPAPTYNLSADPVNLVSGAFTSDHDDITVGSGALPYGLNLSRHYDSASQYAAAGPLGLGWTHNYASFARADSDGFAGMGLESPISGAAAIATAYILQDLLNGGSNVKPLDRLIIAVQAERWLMDQLTGNVVNVIQGASSLQFVKLPDGSYNAPLRSNATLALSGGLYTLKTADQTQFNFNTAGNLATIHWTAGPTATLAYNGSNQLTSVTNGIGRTLTLAYTGDQITSVTDGTRTVQYTYDSAKNLTVFRDPLSNNITYTYDAPGRMTKIYFPSFPSNAFVTNTYSALDKVNVQQDANGNTSNLYLAGSRAEEVNALGQSNVTYMTGTGQTRVRVDALGNQTASTYDGLDRLTAVTFPELNAVSYAYDNLHGPTALQNVLSVTATPKPASGSPTLVTSYTYDLTFNKVSTSTDARGATTSYIYDIAGGTGNLLEIDQPMVGGLTPTTLFTYNSRGQLLTKTDPTGKITLNAYDATTEALLSVTDDNANLKIKTQFGYDAVGNITSLTDPNNNVSTMTYDAARRVTQVTAPASTSAVTKVTYNADGDVTKVERATGNVGAPWQTGTATYSFSGKKLTETDPNNNVTTYTYDAADRLLTVKDAANRITTNGYDVLGRLVSQTNTAIQAAPLVEYAYSNNGQRRTLKDANGNLSTYVYDGLDRLAGLQYPSATRGAGVSNPANAEAYTYDANGNVLTRTKRDGTVITATYDVLNRSLTKQYPGHVNDVYYVYDLAGRLLSARYGSTSGAGVIYGYDTAGRVTSEATNGQSMFYAYDAASNRIRVTWPDAFYVTYGFDALNRVTAIRENGAASGPGVLATYTYDPLSRTTAGALGDGATAAYGYDAANRLTALTHTMPGGGSALNQTLGFTYTVANQLQSRTATNAIYDWSNYVTGTVGKTADGLNRDSAIAALSNGYDGAGNVTNDGARTFTYDFDNRLMGASVAASSTTVTLAYDPASRLRQQQTTVGAGSPVTTNYLYDGSRLSAEYDGSGTLLRRYVHGVGVDQPILWYEGAGVTDRRWLHADERGSIIAYSNISGSVTSYSYGPYGEPTAWGGSRFAYTGQIQIGEVQLYHYKARVYDPIAGRFLQTDPIGTEADIHLYGYARGDPINLTDATGLNPGDPFSDARSAAVDAQNYINSTSINYNIEFAGYIYSSNGNYYASNPVAGGVGTSTASLPLRGQTVEAYYHTHGDYTFALDVPGTSGFDFVTTQAHDSYNSDNFSDHVSTGPGDPQGDIQNAQMTGLPTYVGTPSGAIKEYNPSTGQTTIVGNTAPSAGYNGSQSRRQK